MFRFILFGLVVLVSAFLLSSCPLACGAHRIALELPVRVAFFDNVKPALLEKYPGILIKNTTCICRKDYCFHVDIATSGAEGPYEVAAEFNRLRQQFEPLARSLCLRSTKERQVARSGSFSPVNSDTVRRRDRCFMSKVCTIFSRL